MWYKLKRILIYPDGITEKQVRPSEVIECDFTKSDCWFVFKFRSDNTVNYGIDSNGLYTTKTGNAAMVTRGIPSSIYSKGWIKKIVLRLYSTATRNGWWISTNDWQSTTRVWTYFGDTWIENYWNGISSHQDVGNTPAWWYDFTIDLENKVASVSFWAYSLALPDATITAIKSAWSNWNLWICAMMAIWGTTAYIQKATFYF